MRLTLYFFLPFFAALGWFAFPFVYKWICVRLSVSAIQRFGDGQVSKIKNVIHLYAYECTLLFARNRIDIIQTWFFYFYFLFVRTFLLLFGFPIRGCQRLPLSQFPIFAFVLIIWFDSGCSFCSHSLHYCAHSSLQLAKQRNTDRSQLSDWIYKQHETKHKYRSEITRLALHSPSHLYWIIRGITFAADSTFHRQFSKPFSIKNYYHFRIYFISILLCCLLLLLLLHFRRLSAPCLCVVWRRSKHIRLQGQRDFNLKWAIHANSMPTTRYNFY